MPSTTTARMAIDDQILEVVDRVRARHRACSLGMLATALGVSKQHIANRCDVLRSSGELEWSDGFGGSIRRTGTVEVPAARLRALEALAMTHDQFESWVALDDRISEWLATNEPPVIVPTPASEDAAPANGVATVDPGQIPPIPFDSETPGVWIDGKFHPIDRAKLSAVLSSPEAQPRQRKPKKAAAPASKRAAARARKAGKVDTRTPEQIQAAKDRMARVRAGRKADLEGIAS